MQTYQAYWDQIYFKESKIKIQVHHLVEIMAMRKVVVFIVMMVAVWGACNGACNLNVQDLMVCKPAVALSNPTNPSPGCCNMVRSLSGNDIQCLCNYKANQAYLLRSFGVDPDRCTQLPALCNLPPINCWEFSLFGRLRNSVCVDDLRMRS